MKSMDQLLLIASPATRAMGDASGHASYRVGGDSIASGNTPATLSCGSTAARADE